MDNVKFAVKYTKVKKDHLINLDDRKNSYERGFLYKKDDVNTSRDWPLKILILKGRNELIISGSIRKWYHGKYSPKNLTLVDYMDCLQLIIKRLGLKKKDLMLSAVQKLEVSLSLNLSPKNQFILLSFVDYKGFYKATNGHNSLRFEGEAYNIKMYDQLVKILDEIKYKDKRTGRERNLTEGRKKKILNRRFVLRCELDVNRMHKMDPSFIKFTRRPFDLFRYWEEIYISFREKLNRIGCYTINKSLQKEFDNMNFSQSNMLYNLKDGTQKDAKRFLDEFTICVMGIEKMYHVANVLESPKAKYEFKKYLKSTLQDYVETENDHEILMNAFDQTVVKIV